MEQPTVHKTYKCKLKPTPEQERELGRVLGLCRVLYNTALSLVRENDTIYHEDLQTANMLKNHHLAKSIQDASWSAFLRILTYKAAGAGRRVVAVPPAYTSQRCSGCGEMVQKGLSVRWHRCPECGTSLHRDYNAARNRELARQALRGGVAVAASENRASAGL
jgi:IS605 OrfB family transposase